MNKAEILQELPRLAKEDCREIFDLICDIEEHDLLKGGELSADEKALLDRKAEAYQKEPNAGSSWAEVRARLCVSS